MKDVTENRANSRESPALRGTPIPGEEADNGFRQTKMHKLQKAVGREGTGTRNGEGQTQTWSARLTQGR